MHDNPLGRATPYSDNYDPELLFAVSRTEGRASLGLTSSLPFHGVDLWTAYELSWLDNRGRPLVAVMTAVFPADSRNLIESKSLKLYLNSFSMSRFAAAADVSSAISRDLSAACGSDVEISFAMPSDAAAARITVLPGELIDAADIACTAYVPDASLLQAAGEVVEETLHSHVLRSLCPVTGQADTGSILINYRGPRLDRAALFAYLVSFRQHADFHELCVERIFCDLLAQCRCEALTVYARYNRRGGIDINPFRSNVAERPQPMRAWRQ
jgi:7-cyano-7-deazaguanine reductase